MDVDVDDDESAADSAATGLLPGAQQDDELLPAAEILEEKPLSLGLHSAPVDGSVAEVAAAPVAGDESGLDPVQSAARYWETEEHASASAVSAALGPADQSNFSGSPEQWMELVRKASQSVLSEDPLPLLARGACSLSCIGAAAHVRCPGSA